MAIEIACEQCGFQYRLKDELAGRKVKCKECQAVFVVPARPAPPTPAATTGHGDPVYRYSDEPRPATFQMAIGDSENIERISDHIERYCGPVSGVLHEILSEYVHIDVHCVGPTKERPQPAVARALVRSAAVAAASRCASTCRATFRTKS